MMHLKNKGGIFGEAEVKSQDKDEEGQGFGEIKLQDVPLKIFFMFIDR